MASNVDGTPRARRTPTLFGVSVENSLLWDGRVDTVEAAIENALESTEMAVDWQMAIKRLEMEPAIFSRLGDNQDLGSGIVVRALAAYVDTISVVETRFDRFRKGDQSALSDKETSGLRIFTHKARCSSCHLVDGDRSPFTDGGFHNNGLTIPTNDLGRAAVTCNLEDMRAFKTPSLRGVALRPYLMHDGSFTNLKNVVIAYDRSSGAHVDPRIKQNFLTNDEIDSIVAFLGALNPISSTP